MRMRAVFLRVSPEIAFLATLLVSSWSIASGNGLEGNWQTGEDNSVVQVFEQDSEYFGKLVSSDNPNAKMGTQILRNFKQVDGVWKGTLYAAKRDQLLDAVITPQANTLNITVKAGLVSKKLAWQRVQP